MSDAQRPPTQDAPRGKACTRCGARKSWDEFHRDRSRSDGFQSHCKGCDVAKKRRHRAANREAIAERERRYREVNSASISERKRRWRGRNAQAVVEGHRQWHAANRERELARLRQWSIDNREPVRERRRQRNFNISPDDHDEMLSIQAGGCAICGEPPRGGKALAVDHDHSCCPGVGRSCGRCVRGLLCGRCNLAIGAAGDSPALLRAAAAYLEAFQSGLTLMDHDDA
jgi:hypothetical protein